MNALRIKQALYFIIAVLLINSCKKKDPDCATCPCPLCPRIDTLIPNHGRPGDTLILKGVNFNVDPFLNLVTFNDTLAQEVLEATATELKVIVPEGTTTGPVKIKINDEDTLGSDEIPEFDEPVFALDYFVELVAGMPEDSGVVNSNCLSSKFSSLTKMAFDDNYMQIFLLDKAGYYDYIRAIRNDAIETLFTSYQTLVFPTISYIDIAPTFNEYLFFTEDSLYLQSNVSSIQKVKFNTITSNLLPAIKSYSSGYPFRNIKNLELNQSNGVLYYTLTGSGTFNPCIIKYNMNISKSDTIIKYTSNSELLNVDIELFEEIIYGYKKNGIYKLSLQNGQPIETLITDSIYNLGGIAVDKYGRVFFSSNHEIFRVNPDGRKESIAGSIIPGYNPTIELGKKSLFRNIKDIDFDKDNNLYIVDAGNYCIRRLKID